MARESGRYSRGYLPHIEAGRTPQFITIRLVDSLPRALLVQWKAELAQESDIVRKRELYRRVEQHLDLGRGSCKLKNPIAAKIVQDSLLFHDGTKHDLHAWCVMPNHAHFLITPNEGFTLDRIVRPLKSFTAKKINRVFGKDGRFWQRDFFDRFARDDKHFETILKSIEWNPVKAGLTQDPTLWPYSSANRHLRRPEGQRSGMRA
jgi:REP element-mobilizing transposase RayT